MSATSLEEKISYKCIYQFHGDDNEISEMMTYI